MGKKKIGKFVYPQTGTQVEKIEQAFKLLGLENCGSSFEFLAQKIQEEGKTILDFQEELLKGEVQYQEDKRLNRWIQQAKLPQLKTIDGHEDTRFNFAAQPVIKPAQIRELASCRFIEQGKNVILLGPTGVGKTHLALALGFEAIQQAYEVKNVQLNEFINLFHSASISSSETSKKRLFRSLAAPKLLILDDIDYYTPSEEAGEFLFDVLMQRYKDQLSILVTSNKNPKDWNLFGTPERSRAILDRIFDHSRAIIINIMDGRSYRVPQPLEQAISNPEPIRESSKLRSLISSASKSMTR